MNVPLLHRIDRWLGIPACLVLTLFRKLMPEPPRELPVKRVVFVKLAEQGSSVLAVDAIRAAVRMVGRDNVYFAVFEDNRFILDLMELVPPQNILTVAPGPPWKLLRSGIEVIMRLRKLRVDAAIDMEFFTRGSAAFTFLTGARCRVGFHNFYGAGPWRGDLMTHRLLYNPHLHTARMFRAMVEAVSRKPDEGSGGLLPYPEQAEEKPLELPAFNPRQDEKSGVVRMLNESIGNLSQLVLLNPNASDLLPLRRWPAENYVALASALLKESPNLGVIFTGAPHEAPIVDSLAVQVSSPRCVSLAGRTTLRELLVLFTMTDLLITNDSGPAHFAALTPISTITLFGPETPLLYGSLSAKNVSLWAGIMCSPCVNAYNSRQSPCRNNACMQAITVDMVLEAALLILRGHPGGGSNSPRTAIKTGCK